MQHLNCDVTGEDLTESKASVLVIRGPLRSMLGRSRIELGKPAALALARWLDPDVQRPGLEEIEGPESDLGVFGVSVDPAIRVQALEHGTPAGSRPPKGRATRRN